ncbi:MAG: DUF3164 family protein [Rikenellaceae bacterium]
MDITNLSKEQKQELFAQLQKEQQSDVNERREAYEKLRKDVVERIKERVVTTGATVKELFDFVKDETSAFYAIMSEYGALSRDGQMNYTLMEDDFKVEVRTHKIKKFDERAELAAARLVEFLKEWMAKSAKGVDDPMYQLAMSMLSRNQNGDLDYKSISKLYEMEDKFNDPNYSEIMTLFKESNKVDSTTTNFYFHKRSDMGVWSRVEVSFNRM